MKLRRLIGRSRRRGGESASVSLFPFLAVLICTMGALILLLVVFSRHINAQAAQEKQEQLAQAAEQIKTTEGVIAWRTQSLIESRDKTGQQLTEARLKLGQIESHLLDLKNRARELDAALKRLIETDSGSEGEDQQLADELARVQAEIARAESELESKQREANRQRKAYAIIPFDGQYGTRRRPIYLECRSDGVILQPEGVTLIGPEDPLYFLAKPGNSLDQTLRAIREYWAEHDAGSLKQGEPYPLLIIRPDGIDAYYLARNAMRSWGDEFGYEAVDADMVLAYPAPDARLAQMASGIVAEVRQRQRGATDFLRQAITSVQEGGNGLSEQRLRPSLNRGGGLVASQSAMPRMSDLLDRGDPEDLLKNPLMQSAQAGGSGNTDRATNVGGGGNIAGDAIGNGNGNDLGYGMGGAGSGAGSGTATGTGLADVNTTGSGTGSYSGSGTGYGSNDRYGLHNGLNGAQYAGMNGSHSQYRETGSTGTGPGNSTGSGSGTSFNGHSGGYPGNDSGGHSDGANPLRNEPNMTGMAGMPSGTGTTQTPGMRSNGGYAGGYADGSHADGSYAGSVNGGTSGMQGTSDGQGTTNSQGMSATQSAAGGMPGGMNSAMSSGATMPSGMQPGAAMSGGSAGAAGGSSGMGGVPGQAGASCPAGGMPSINMQFGSTPQMNPNANMPSSTPPEEPQPRAVDLSRPGAMSQLSSSAASGESSPFVSTAIPLSQSRGMNWALPGQRSQRMMALSRPIRLDCYADRLIFRSGRNDDSGDTSIRLGNQAIRTEIDQFVSAVWARMDQWGGAGVGMYWKPILTVHEMPGGQPRVQELRVLLEGSGLDIEVSRQ